MVQVNFRWDGGGGGGGREKRKMGEGGVMGGCGWLGEHKDWKGKQTRHKVWQEIAAQWVRLFDQACRTRREKEWERERIVSRGENVFCHLAWLLLFYFFIFLAAFGDWLKTDFDTSHFLFFSFFLLVGGTFPRQVCFGVVNILWCYTSSRLVAGFFLCHMHVRSPLLARDHLQFTWDIAVDN